MSTLLPVLHMAFSKKGFGVGKSRAFDFEKAILSYSWVPAMLPFHIRPAALYLT